MSLVQNQPSLTTRSTGGMMRSSVLIGLWKEDECRQLHILDLKNIHLLEQDAVMRVVNLGIELTKR